MAKCLRLFFRNTLRAYEWKLCKGIFEEYPVFRAHLAQAPQIDGQHVLLLRGESGFTRLLICKRESKAGLNAACAYVDCHAAIGA